MGQQQSARVARYNRAVVLDLIRRHGPIAKSDLADRSGLAVSSVLNVLASLSRRGLIREVGLGPSTGGRPPTLVELNPGAHFAVGVNIRPTYAEAVLMDLVGNIKSQTTMPLQGGLDPHAVAGSVVEATSQAITLGRVDAARVLGVGVGCPGPVTNGRIVVGTPGLPWKQVPLADMLERLLGLPVMIENDANVAALAEFRHGACSRLDGCDSLVYLYMDHGVGAGIVIDGNLYRGADGTAGEIGHTIVDVDGPLCLCGNYGCLEAVASVGSIIRRTITASKLGGTSALAERAGGDWDAVSFEVVMEAVERKDPLATSALEAALSYLAIGITNLGRQFRPGMIILGGYLFEHSGTPFLRLQRALERRPALFGMAPPEVQVGELGGRAPCIGAATLVLENFFGVAQQVMSADRASQLPEPAFERTPIWPELAELGIILKPSNARIAWAGNLQPSFSRVVGGQPIGVTVDVRLEDTAVDGRDIKALLHWDRIALFGGHWSTPKNSPMHMVSSRDGCLTYGVTLGSLPPGRYEFAAHVLGANDIWVRSDGPSDTTNGRAEVLPSRGGTFVAGNSNDGESTSRKEADRHKELVER